MGLQMGLLVMHPQMNKSMDLDMDCSEWTFTSACNGWILHECLQWMDPSRALAMDGSFTSACNGWIRGKI
eukprot:364952-Chlamydomonas_euryale.AAC.6